MKYQCTLLAVRDVEASKRFYGELFDQTIVLKLGKNDTCSGGFAIQQDFGWLTGIPEGEIIQHPKEFISKVSYPVGHQ